MQIYKIKKIIADHIDSKDFLRIKVYTKIIILSDMM